MTPGCEPERPATAAKALELWLAAPQVLADPHQAEARGVWTRAQDVLPGVVVRHGIPLTAVWEDLTWIGLPVWDEEELDHLWLQPCGPPAEVPDPRGRYTAAPLLSALLAAAEAEPDSGRSRELHRLATGLAEWLDDALVDFRDSLQLLMNAVRSDRRVAQDVLREIGNLRRGEQRALMSSPAGQALLRVGRRAAARGHAKR